ncbi:FG-GAP repeat domain-containing protein [Glycomyces albidus]|uniref:VCBS repeat-containing protein n=1 Tax=Glycomyces albidus TaxID=2656774 RepID=A0A6L5G7R1_9ACTN|nr:VCBS repeat-containing protein [Glycomyces albidus]MQM25692.1 hypothetical protein [Glycomyces albidus]
MNEASRPERRPFRRAAPVAAVAVAVAATLAAPGPVSAQTIDCSTLGDNPRRSGIAAALDAAAACAVEVRVSARAWDQMTVYATPAGQLHLVSTAEAVQEYLDSGPSDPTLEAFAGTLAQTNSRWWAYLRYDDPEAPLFDTLVGGLDWAGDIPVPTYEGTTAFYDELSPGLDLTADVGSTDVGFRFNVADLDAWNALATGLLTDASRAEAVDGSLRFDDTDSKPDTEWTTPFTVRDAAGAVHRADLDLAGDGALTVTLSEEALAAAEFPLTLSTQWADRSYRANEWGAVTSAAADSTLYRGEAGLDEPYFAAAGQSADAVGGSYCDDLAGGECAQAEAAVYWNFEWPMLAGLDPDTSYTFEYPVSAAVFSVDAAEGAACSAPKLNLTEEYSAAATWNDRPAVIGSAGAGECEGGTARYDLTDAVSGAWSDPEASGSVTFGTADSTETARFDGGSARLDVFFDIAGFFYAGPHYSLCRSLLDAAPFFKTATPEYGNTLVKTWRSETLDLGLTWTATFTDQTTGAVALTTDPKPVPLGSSPYYVLEDPLPNGKYRVEYDFSSTTVDFSYRAAPCYLVVDTAAPEFLDITVEPGQRYVGDTVGAAIEVADEGFPDGLNALTVGCSVCTGPAGVLTENGVHDVEIQVTDTNGRASFYLLDKAGNSAELPVLDLPATYSKNDFDGDRHQDLVTVRRSDGALLLHAGKGDGTFAAPTVLATGWGHMDVTMPGDITSDGRPDLFARDNRNGNLYTYPGDGDGGFGTRISAGSGWNTVESFAVGEFFYSGFVDLIGVKSDGAVVVHRGNGDGTFGASPVGTSQLGRSVDMIVNLDNLSGENEDELMVRDARTGEYWIYHLRAGQTSSAMAGLADLESSAFNTRLFSSVTSAGDTDGDNYADLVAVDAATGELVRESFRYDYGLHAVATDQVEGTGWGRYRLPSVQADGTYDYTGDGNADVFARRASDGKLYVYNGNGSTGFGPIGTWGTGLKSLTLLETAGDFDGDGFADLLGRDSDGALYLYPGNGGGGHDPASRLRIGTGWNAMSAIVSGQDFNGDGKVDLIARDKATGYLWLYPGKGDGTLAARVQFSTGWNGMREITSPGDLDHDGHADVIGIRSSNDCMYFYGGRGDGTLKAGVLVSCNWTGYDQVAAVEDFDGDGHGDWIARRQADGRMYLYRGNGTGGFDVRVTIVTGWTWANAVA